MTRVLGLDISSTCIGICVLEIIDGEIKFVSAEYLKPIKKGSIIDRIVDTRNKIKDIIERVNPDHIVIEEIIQFMKGQSTAKTIITLTTFNRMICLLAYDCLKKNPELFNVMSIRHGLKLENILPKKEDMPELVAKHLSITFPYELNKKGNIKVENYDMADGVAVALYGAFLLTGKIKAKIKKSKKK
jgi:Holliday junction resolvasome RuvABC endonuclease subunit